MTQKQNFEYKLTNGYNMKLILPKKPITFDRFEEDYGIHPVIFFYSDLTGSFYYLKSRSAYNKKQIQRKPYEYEVLIKKLGNGLLYNDSYIDTTQIYKLNIAKEDLYKVFEKDSVLFLDTEYFNIDDIDEIYSQLYRNLKNNPPFVSISQIYFYDEEVKSRTLYSHQNFLDMELNTYKSKSNISVEQIIQKQELYNEIINYSNNNYDILFELKELSKGCDLVLTDIHNEINFFNEYKNKISSEFSSFITDNKFDFNKYYSSQLEQIYLGLKANLDVKKYTKNIFNGFQMQQIRLGLQKDYILDKVYLYIDPKYDWKQMQEIRKELELSLDVKLYLDSKLSYYQMQQIRNTLLEDKMKVISDDVKEKGLDSEYMNELNIPYFDAILDEVHKRKQNTSESSSHMQIVNIKHKVAKADEINSQLHLFNEQQQEQIKLGIHVDINVYSYLDPKLSANQMQEIRYHLLEEKVYQMNLDLKENGIYSQYFDYTYKNVFNQFNELKELYSDEKSDVKENVM
ncbi:Mbov_0400 family ICE element protein [Mycoplasma sp. 246B]